MHVSFALCSGVRAVQVSYRCAHATLRLRLALARLNRMQVVVGAFPSGERGPPIMFRVLPFCRCLRRVLIFSDADAMRGVCDYQPGQRMAISDFRLPKIRGSWTAGEGDAAHDDDQRADEEG